MENPREKEGVGTRSMGEFVEGEGEERGAQEAYDNYCYAILVKVR